LGLGRWRCRTYLGPQIAGELVVFDGLVVFRRQLEGEDKMHSVPELMIADIKKREVKFVSGCFMRSESLNYVEVLRLSDHLCRVL
jgi:hypothetical protein